MRRSRLLSLPTAFPIVSALLTVPAMAHHLPPGLEEIDEFADSVSFMMGVNHPLSGWDHLVAALLIGAVAARFGTKGRVALPLLSLAAMMLGCFAPPLPGAEGMILASVAAGAAALWFRSSRSLQTVAAALVLFQAWHGNTHAMEIPLTVERSFYLAGTGAGTLLAMVLGLAGAVLLRRWVPDQEEEAALTV